MLALFEDVFLVIDALDECDDRSHVLKLVDVLLAGSDRNFHLLLASRREIDIERALTGSRVSDIVDLSWHIDVDIKQYLQRVLSNERFHHLYDEDKLWCRTALLKVPTECKCDDQQYVDMFSNLQRMAGSAGSAFR